MLRNSWNDDKRNDLGLPSIIDIGGHDYRNYSWIMKCCEDIIYEMIPDVIEALMQAYGIEYKKYKVQRNDAYVFSVSDNEDCKDYEKKGYKNEVFLFSANSKNQERVLYVFKEFGIKERLPLSIIKTIINEYNLDGYCFISFTEKDAYLEQFNRNDDLEDSSRGTGLYSLKFFYDYYFGEGEYETFKKYACLFTNKVRDYFGFEVVRTLKPNTLHNFRQIVRKNLLEFDVCSFDTDGRLSDKQKEIVNKNFFTNKRYELLTGTSDFAESYMTAEWLFYSLKDAGNIDFTAVAMGYFKAVEQLLFKMIKLHTIEKDGVSRKIYVGKGKDYADNDGNIELTDAHVEDEDIVKDISLGTLTGFFGYYSDLKNYYYKRNQDLLADGIDEKTYEYIIDVLTGIVGMRNEYFHKHNLNQWEKVIEARDSARLVFWIILGAYNIDDNDKVHLGYIQGNEHDDFYQLCEYMNNNAYNVPELSIPIYYINGQTDPYVFLMGYHDDYIEYDKYGEPIYSGVYFKSVGEKKFIIKTTKDKNHPDEIWEGELSISMDIPIKFTPSGPKKRIYKDGRFYAE